MCVKTFQIRDARIRDIGGAHRRNIVGDVGNGFVAARRRDDDLRRYRLQSLVSGATEQLLREPRKWPQKVAS